MTAKSGNESVGLTGPAANQGGTAGHLPTGYALREFQIDRVLGEGGFSVVYLATDTRLERQVAIKEYMPTALATRNNDLSVHVRSSAQHREAFEAGLRSFINEAKLLAKFEHRALVKVHQFWQEKGTAYMVMPYYSGPTLKSWIKQQHEPVDATWLEQFLRLVMDAVETLHRENCLHRDVAPDNILILNERSPLLLDFGAARRVIGDLTQALTVILKPGFAPIEQYAESQSMRQGPWTDVYALCAVAHFMITGRAPTPSVTRVLADDLVPLHTVAEGRFPPAFLAALDAGLTVRPQQRPQSIAALRELMNGTAPEDNTLTAPPGVSTAFLPGTVPSTIRPLTPTIAPDGLHNAEDDEKTRMVTARDLPLYTSPGTISSPDQPAIAPVEPATDVPVEGDPTFGTRFPSRSMRELAGSPTRPAEAEVDDKGSKLPLLLGGIAIAVVIGVAWALINWMDSENDLLRAPQPVNAPAPAPTPVPAPAPAPRTAQAPVPGPTNAAPAAALTPPPSPASPSATPPAPTAATAVPSPVPATAPSATPATSNPPPIAAANPTPSSAAQSPAPASTKVNPPEKQAAKAAAPAPSLPAPAMSAAPSAGKAQTKPETPTSTASKNTSAPAQTATAAAPQQAPKPTPALPVDARPAGGGMSTSPSKSGNEPARARPTTQPTGTTAYVPPPLAEPAVAPAVSVPQVATVDASPAPPPVAAVEPPRAANPPAPLAGLRPLSRPDPMFPREALRANVDKGTVRARLFIAADGTVSKVVILSAQPARVFDREVRETTLRWRYEPPGQPRQTDVEFVFDPYKNR